MTDTTDVAPRSRTVSPLDLLRPPVRRWRTTLAGVLLGLLGAVGYLATAGGFEATAVVAVRPVVTDPFTYPGPGSDRVVNMTVENGLATGTEVVTAVAAATGQGEEAARASLTVELPDGSQVLRFRYAAPTADAAVAGANAAANTYLDVRRRLYQTQRDARIASYDQSIAALAAERDKVRAALPSGAGSVAATAALDRLRSLNDQLGELATRRADAAAVDVTPGTVTRIATPPAAPGRMPLPIVLIAALAGGLLAGAVLATAVEALSRRVRTGYDAATISGLPLLAELRGRRFGQGRSQLTADLRYLVPAILGRLGPATRRIVLLAPGSGELPTGVAAGLAVALADGGNEVHWQDLTPEAPLSRSRVLASATGPITERPRPTDTTEPLTRPRPSPVLVEQRERDRTSASVTRSVPIGRGRVWLIAPADPDEKLITLVRAVPADWDALGVRSVQQAAVVLVARRDHTRAADLDRLATTLRLSGVRTLGIVLVSGHD
ncbi:hypothetical protein [Catenuloplanes indicus]|uniref:Uncharacterized protein involved in exopolysaccharide biosynthesis n=1 Tax=Catenuloplanes indicus TaxID=137267 RepID=A0AAE4B1V8_9ACTN|nr:hypothetical protein [Catenuloplanes indicus]MDQ0371059.1 uncharacterized protein involved in exopolysaccharide biosynthesis [Catenuloplanes indicus]